MLSSPLKISINLKLLLFLNKTLTKYFNLSQQEYGTLYVEKYWPALSAIKPEGNFAHKSNSSKLVKIEDRIKLNGGCACFKGRSEYHLDNSPNYPKRHSRGGACRSNRGSSRPNSESSESSKSSESSESKDEENNILLLCLMINRANVQHGSASLLLI